MPCNSDYLNPTHAEMETQRVAKLLMYLRNSLGLGVTPDMETNARTIYPSTAYLNFYVVSLCDLLKKLTPDQLDTIVYDGRNSNARELADWWEQHERADFEREKQKQQQIKDEATRLKALSKLNDEEKRVLGVK